MPPFISSDLQTEWKFFRRYILNQPKEDMNEQLKEMPTSLKLYPSSSTPAKVCLTLSVGTASVKCSLSQMKMDKNLIKESPGRS